MDENLKSSASEFVAGESNPAEFTAEAVVEYLESDVVTDEEARRVGDLEFNGDDAKKRSTVGEAASKVVDGEDDGDEKGDESPDTDSSGDTEDENYNPYQDPAVGSSALADVIVGELQNGDSPTLEACREAYKDYNKQG